MRRLATRLLAALLLGLTGIAAAEPGAAWTPGPAEAPACGAALAAAPIPIGEKDQFARIGGLARGAALGLASSLLGTATGGVVDLQGGSGAPELYKDALKKKHRRRLRDPASRIKLRVAGRLLHDGLVLSSRIDRAKGKGTLHLAYLERDDCRRIHPFQQLAYELWGEWKLTVSFDDSGTYSASSQWLRDRGHADRGEPGGLTPELAAYQRALRSESGLPIWRRLGFGAPLSGARAVGTMYRLGPDDVRTLEQGRMTLVLHVTRKRDGLYESVGIPLRVLHADRREHLDFEVIEERPPL